MSVYSIILFLVGGLCLALGIAIYRGKTDLIHDYHQKNVSDKAAYGKAFGKAVFVIAAAQLISGVIALFAEDSRPLAAAAVAVLIIGLAVGIGCFIAVQKKFNGGIF